MTKPRWTSDLLRCLANPTQSLSLSNPGSTNLNVRSKRWNARSRSGKQALANPRASVLRQANPLARSVVRSVSGLSDGNPVDRTTRKPYRFRWRESALTPPASQSVVLAAEHHEAGGGAFEPSSTSSSSPRYFGIVARQRRCFLSKRRNTAPAMRGDVSGLQRRFLAAYQMFLPG